VQTTRVTDGGGKDRPLKAVCVIVWVRATIVFTDGTGAAGIVFTPQSTGL